MGNIGWLISRVQKAAPPAALRRPPLPQPPPPLPPARSPVPPPPPRLPAPESLDRSYELPLEERFQSEDPYLQEWNRFMDAGLPNEYRTYGARELGKDPQVRALASLLEATGIPSTPRFHAPEALGSNAYFRSFVDTRQRLTPMTFNVAQKKINQQGDMAAYLQVYGPGPEGRPAVLYSIPADTAEAAGMADKLQSLGYTRTDDYSPPQ